MLTLIVPCAGRNFINNQPRWSLTYSDTDSLLSECIKRIGLRNYDRIIITILKEDLRFYSQLKRVKNLSNKIEICVLDEETNGPADTVYQTIKKMEVYGSIQVKDIDIIFEMPKNNGNFISGIHLMNYNADLINVRNKSFITRNENNVVMDIIEKNVKSDIISIGLYGFANSNDFVNTYIKLKDSFSDRDMIYVSHIISYLIGVDNKIFDFEEIKDFESLESEKVYNNSIKKRGTYIIDGKNINILDHINEVKALHNNGGKIIIIIDDLKLEETKKVLLRNQLTDVVVVNGPLNNLFIKNEIDLKEVYLNAI